MSNVFVSAGWPYLYEVPGLHNVIPMLFADSVARWRRFRGDSVTFVSGADEHGPRVEFVAEGRGISPRALVDEKVAATEPLLRRLGISLDRFARTTDPAHQVFVQRLLTDMVSRGAAERRTVEIPWCQACERFLPDRFVEGRCPRCGGSAFGNQCSDKRSCGAALEPADLVEPHCAICGGGVRNAAREHLYLPFAPLRSRISAHIDEHHRMFPLVRRRAQETLTTTDGMVLTRDSLWGIPTPDDLRLPGRTVYSWVDALLGKVSAVDSLERPEIWSEPSSRKIFFLGADGIPFYGVLLPALLLASGRPYALDGFRIIPNDVLVYEGSVCSKSSRTGIWLPEALRLLPGDYWRFAVFEAEAKAAVQGRTDAPADLDFRWGPFASSANATLGALELNVAASVSSSAPSDDDACRRALGIAEEAMDALRPGAAFGHLLDALTRSPGPSRSQVAAAIPLLSCFLPDTAVRAESVLHAGGACLRLFPELPIDGAVLRRVYLAGVTLVRAALDLRAELADVRADDLCVCPARLDES